MSYALINVPPSPQHMLPHMLGFPSCLLVPKRLARTAKVERQMIHPPPPETKKDVVNHETRKENRIDIDLLPEKLVTHP